MYKRQKYTRPFGKNITELDIYKDPFELYRIIYDLSENKTCSNDMDFYRKDGCIFTGLLSAKSVMIDGAKYIISTVNDITNRKLAEDMLKESEKKFRTYTEKAPLGIFVTDDTGRLTEVNPAVCSMTGYMDEEMQKLSLKDLFVFDTDKNIAKMIKKVKTRGRAEEDIKIITKSNTRYWADITSVSISDNRFLYFCKDITERKNSEERFLYLAEHDYLTDLYNRRFFEDRLNRLDEQGKLPITLVICDVNGLKLINDSFGHEKGDELLMEVADIIRRSCRKHDIAARLGGSEFAVILPEAGEGMAELIIKHMRKFSAARKVNNTEISLSFGHGTKVCKEDNIKEIFRNTEDLMYKHKLHESLSMRSRTIDLIINTLFEKNAREMMHSRRVSEICESIAVTMGMNADEVNDLKTVGLMHDIGKIGIDDAILNKPQRLNDREWNEIKKHPEIGYRILSSVNEFSEIADSVLKHHERWDGKGYPKGLKGEEISIQARILSFADAYDAMTSNRTYCVALSEEDAMNEVRRCSGTQFDPMIAEIFINKILRKRLKKMCS